MRATALSSHRPKIDVDPVLRRDVSGRGERRRHPSLSGDTVMAETRLTSRSAASIEPPEWNARTNHDIDGIVESIRVNGFRDPIEVWATQGGKRLPEPHAIVAGEGRYRAAVFLDMAEVPVVEFDFDDLDAARRYAIANNRLTDKSEWDLDELVNSLSSLPDLDGTGFTPEELEELAFYPETAQAPDEFPSVGEDLGTNRKCPSCGYQWSESE